MGAKHGAVEDAELQAVARWRVREAAISNARHGFETSLEREEPGHVTLEAAARVPIAGGPPPELGGTTIRWSPEHLFVGAVGLCFMTTLDWLASRRDAAPLELRCRARGTVEETPRGRAFTAVELEVTATAQLGQVELVRELIAEAEATCLVSASLACPVRVRAEVTEGHLG